MGNTCQNQNIKTTQTFIQEQDSILKEENLKAIQNMNPDIKKHEYLLENLSEGIEVSIIEESQNTCIQVVQNKKQIRGIGYKQLNITKEMKQIRKNNTITSIIIKPRNQAQVLEILRGIKNLDTEIKYNKHSEQGQGTPSSKNNTNRSMIGKFHSEKHVHFQIPQMQIVKHEYKYWKKQSKK